MSDTKKSPETANVPTDEHTNEREPVFMASSFSKSQKTPVNEPSAPRYSDVPLHLLESQLKLKIGSSKPAPAVMSPLLPHSSATLHSQLLTPVLRLNLDLAREVGAAQPSSGPGSTASTPKPGLVSANSDLKPWGHSVSFCENDPQDRSRRFTISAHPLSVHIAGPVRLNSVQQIPQRKSSYVENAPEIHHGNSALAFLTPNVPDAAFLMNYVSNRAVSPTSTDASQQRTQTPASYTPSPAPSRSNSGLHILTSSSRSNSNYNQHSNLLSHQLSALNIANMPNGDSIASRRGSRHGSEGIATPITILRKNSLNKKSNKTLVLSPVGPPVPFQQFLSKEDDKKFHILLACTGSVATIKVPMIIDKLFQVFGSNKISVQLVATKYACHFLKGLKIHKDVKIWRDEDVWTNLREWDANANTTTTPTTSEQAVKKQKTPYDKMLLNNELRKWADIMLIAPLSANTLSKMANGLADNLLTSIVRTWGPTSGSGPNCVKKPILIAPAMNTYMYTHPLTSKHLKILSLTEEGFGMEVLKPVEKVLVCGDIGMGGMREWLDIVDQLKRKIKTLVAEKAAMTGSSIDEEIEEDKDENDDNDDQDNDDDEDDDDEDDDDDDDDEDDEDDDDDDDGDDSRNDIDGEIKRNAADLTEAPLISSDKRNDLANADPENEPVRMARSRSLLSTTKPKKQDLTEGLLFDLSEESQSGLAAPRITLSSEVQSII